MTEPTCPEAPTAEEISQLEAHLQCQLGSRVRDLRVLVRSAGLVLRGHAHTYYAKQLAQHALTISTSYPLLANEIEVS